jgi:hypothetical protein
MQRLKLLGLALVATFAFGAMASAAASAAEELPSMLPSNGTFSISATNPEFLNEPGTLNVKCEKLKGNGAGEGGENGMDGKVTLEFENCEGTISGVKAKCKGLADTVEGKITVKAKFNLRYLLPSTEKKVNVAILLTEEHVHFSCSIVLVLVLGCVASDDISPLNTLTKTVTANFLVEKPAGKDIQVVKEIDNLAATAMEACSLKVMTGSNADEPGFQLTNSTLTGISPAEMLIMA